MVQSRLKHCRVSLFDLLPPSWINMLLTGDNGLVTANTVDAHVAEVTVLLHDSERGMRLRQGAKQSAAQCSIENMAEHFHADILQALGEPCVS